MNFYNKSLLIGFLLALLSCSKDAADSVLSENLDQLLDQKNYFKLNGLIEKNKDELPDEKVMYYQTFITKAFGKTDQSNSYINRLLSQYDNKFGDTSIVELLALKAENHLYKYQYKQASKVYTKILEKYPNVLDSAETADYNNSKTLFGTLSNVAPQMMHQHKSVNIKSYINKLNHIMTPVKSNGISSDFVFDTGANLSAISAGQAQKMNLHIFESEVDVGSSTQIKVQSKLAVADSLYMGDILFENVVFLVIPSEQLSFPEIDYQIDGIIGFPIIHQLKEIHLHKGGDMTIPNTSKQRTKNMFLEGLNPVVKTMSDNDTLFFTVDTGAKHSELSFKYYLEHKNHVKEHGNKEMNKRGGAGGRTDVEEYILNDFPIKIGSKKTTLEKIPVALEAYNFNTHFDGNLGQDVLTRFDTLMMNFEDMYITFDD